MVESAAAEIEAWARIVVLRGDAARRVIFEAEYPARLCVGSDPGADLLFSHESVAPRHFDVVWDGSNLWLEDGLRLGRTFVNGKRLNEWQPVLGQVLVAFGPVRLWMKAAGAAPRTSGPNYAALDRASLTDVLRDPEHRRCNTGRITLPPELSDPMEPTQA